MGNLSDSLRRSWQSPALRLLDLVEIASVCTWYMYIQYLYNNVVVANPARNLSTGFQYMLESGHQLTRHRGLYVWFSFWRQCAIIIHHDASGDTLCRPVLYCQIDLLNVFVSFNQVCGACIGNVWYIAGHLSIYRFYADVLRLARSYLLS